MTREEHLQRIAAKCRELLAIAEKPLLARNQKCGCVVCIYDSDTNCYECSTKNCGNHALGQIPEPVYQPHCAGPDEAGWNATIAAIEQARQVIACYEAARIEGLNERLCESQYEPGTLRDLVERRLSYGETEAINLLDSIIAAWPEELL
jgi:hypothetical protein